MLKNYVFKELSLLATLFMEDVLAMTNMKAINTEDVE